MASAPDALYLVDARGVIGFANPGRAIELLGYEAAAELIGRPSHRTIHHRRPDGRPFPEAECPLLVPLQTGETVRVERDWFVRRDGSMLPVAYASAPIELAGERGAIVSFRDITAELRAEEALRERAAEQARLFELQASRARLVEAAVGERRRLARDLHDGAQQHLVRALIELELARRQPSGAEHLDVGIAALRAAIVDLRELAQGIHPRVLVDRGLRPAAALARRPRAAARGPRYRRRAVSRAARGRGLLPRRRGAHQRGQARRRPRAHVLVAVEDESSRSRWATTAAAGRRPGPGAACAGSPTASPRWAGRSSSTARRAVRPGCAPACRSALEPPEDGEHASVLARLVPELELGEDAVTCFSTARA